jgi:hypothetical protein
MIYNRIIKRIYKKNPPYLDGFFLYSFDVKPRKEVNKLIQIVHKGASQIYIEKGGGIKWR